jgi:hypothetical protein
MMLRRRVGLAVLAAIAGSTGCAVTRQGTLAVPGEDRSIPLTISLTSSTAEITAFDPVTGERFEGAFQEEATTRRPIDSGSMGPPIGGGPAPIGSEGIAGGSVRDATINLTGSLTGDQGTELFCALQVEKRMLIRGAGTCRPRGALDEEGKIYRLSF